MLRWIVLSPIVLMASSSQAATLSVCSTCAYTTINGALAASASGDTISVAAGSYTEFLTITKDIDIVGAGSASTTITSASGNVISVNGSGITVGISGFSLRSGTGNGRGMIIQAGDVTLDDLDISGFTSTGGGPAISIYNTASSLTATNLDLDANTASSTVGGHINCFQASMDISNSSMSRGLAADRGGAVRLQQCTADFTNVSFDDNLVEDPSGSSSQAVGGAIFGQNSTASVDSCSFIGNESEEDGGAIGSYEGTWIVTNSTFTANTADDDGGALYNAGSGASSPGTWTVSGSTFESNEAFSAYVGSSTGAHVSGGGAIWMAGKNLEVSDSTFRNNEASTVNGDGGAIHHLSAELVVVDSLFVDNEADTTQGIGGHIVSESDYLELEGNTFTGGQASEGGAIYLFEVSAALGVRNLVCDNTATLGNGGGLYTEEVGASSSEWTNNVFTENEAFISGGGVYLNADNTHEFTNNNFVANDASFGGGFYAADDDFSLVNNIFAYTAGGNGATLFSAGTGYTIDYNDSYDNTPGNWSALITSLGSNNITDEPEFTDYTEDGDCNNDDYRLQYGSALIDAGDPTIPDPDSSVSDIGAYGGPDADPDAFDDADSDGFVAMFDCDDTDSTINPGATEIWYDGIDQNCDGARLR